VLQKDCLANHPWNSIDLVPANWQVLASHDGIAHIYDCPADRNGHRSFVRIDYADGSGYHVSYEHIHNVDSNIRDGQHVSRGTYLGNISIDSNCGGYATAEHTHMSLWHVASDSTWSFASQAVELDGVQIGAWVLDLGSPTPEQYTGCVTPAAWGARLCPTTTLYNDGTVGGTGLAGGAAVPYNGTLQVFGVGPVPGRPVLGTAQNYSFPINGMWGSPVDRGGQLKLGPAAVALVNANTVQVFAVGADNTLWNAYYSGGSWGDFRSMQLGGNLSTTTALAATVFGQTVGVFAVDSNGALWEYYSSNGNPWTSQNLSQIVGGQLSPSTGISTAVYNNTYFGVFAVDSNGALWEYYFSNGTQWQRQNLSQMAGGQLSPSTAISAAVYNSYFGVFAIDPNGTLLEYYTNGGPWQFQPLGGQLKLSLSSGVSAAVYKSYFGIFAIDPNGYLWEYYTNGGPWQVQALPGYQLSVTSGVSAVVYNLTFAVFAIDPYGALREFYSYDGNPWASKNLGGTLSGL
jgi:hypothetical protein